MTLHFVSFVGLAPNAESVKNSFGDAEQLLLRQQTLHQTALAYGEVDVVHAWHRDRLLKTDYYQQNKALLDEPRGCGYWAWKPYIILQTLKQAKENDYVIYCDVGKPTDSASFDHGNQIHTSLLPMVEWAERHNGMLPGVYLSNHGPAKKWIKRDCFTIMDCDESNYHQMPTIQAGYTVWKNTPSVINFLEQWQNLNLDPRLITDQTNALGMENYPGFIRHCHDQATLTLLCEQQKVTVFGDRRHQFWGFRNINYIALEANYQNALHTKSSQFNTLNLNAKLLPNYLVRWIELLMIPRRDDALRCAIIGEPLPTQKATWQRYLPKAQFDYLESCANLNPSTGYDMLIALDQMNSNFNNTLLVNVYAALKSDGLAIVGPLPTSGSEFEKTARDISNSGRFTDKGVFEPFQDPALNPKIPNSRNPIFLSGKNRHSGELEKVCIMVKPVPITQPLTMAGTHEYG